jgi:hypothetical protein
MMKGIITVLIILMAACLFSAMPSGGESSLSILGHENSGALETGADMKRVEVKMNEALSELEAHRRAAIDKKKASDIINTNLSESENNSTNSSAMNSSALNSSVASLPADKAIRSAFSESGEKASSEGTLNESGYAESEGIGANSRANFKGFYGITASQHEMGKNDIDSRTFLSGTFSMDKTVKFQDRGI